MEGAWKVEDARRLLRNVAWTEQFNWQLIALAAFDGVFLRGDGMRVQAEQPSYIDRNRWNYLDD